MIILFWLVIGVFQFWIFYQFHKAWKNHEEINKKFLARMEEMQAAVRLHSEGKDHS